MKKAWGKHSYQTCITRDKMNLQAVLVPYHKKCLRELYRNDDYVALRRPSKSAVKKMIPFKTTVKHSRSTDFCWLFGVCFLFILTEISSIKIIHMNITTL